MISAVGSDVSLLCEVLRQAVERIMEAETTVSGVEDSAVALQQKVFYLMVISKELVTGVEDAEAPLYPLVSIGQGVGGCIETLHDWEGNKAVLPPIPIPFHVDSRATCDVGQNGCPGAQIRMGTKSIR
ncbi:hypothetical protein NDU88_008895 [Pleurodeles waltl]|uniref:Uncharacterized protein n=1 Tax=Pleurodeles waltl TaxID=8319 RepID=A0AAV7RTR9_PLEWA|nr:hypothetical protein NDU88_008895 [Pleurodeles waltl]